MSLGHNSFDWSGIDAKGKGIVGYQCTHNQGLRRVRTGRSVHDSRGLHNYLTKDNGDPYAGHTVHMRSNGGPGEAYANDRSGNTSSEFDHSFSVR